MGYFLKLWDIFETYGIYMAKTMGYIGLTL